MASSEEQAHMDKVFQITVPKLGAGLGTAPLSRVASVSTGGAKSKKSGKGKKGPTQLVQSQTSVTVPKQPAAVASSAAPKMAWTDCFKYKDALSNNVMLPGDGKEYNPQQNVIIWFESSCALPLHYGPEAFNNYEVSIEDMCNTVHDIMLKVNSPTLPTRTIELFWDVYGNFMRKALAPLYMKEAGAAVGDYTINLTKPLSSLGCEHEDTPMTATNARCELTTGQNEDRSRMALNHKKYMAEMHYIYPCCIRGVQRTAVRLLRFTLSAGYFPALADGQLSRECLAALEDTRLNLSPFLESVITFSRNMTRGRFIAVPSPASVVEVNEPAPGASSDATPEVRAEGDVVMAVRKPGRRDIHYTELNLLQNIVYGQMMLADKSNRFKFRQHYIMGSTFCLGTYSDDSAELIRLATHAIMRKWDQVYASAVKTIEIKVVDRMGRALDQVDTRGGKKSASKLISVYINPDRRVIYDKSFNMTVDARRALSFSPLQKAYGGFFPTLEWFITRNSEPDVSIVNCLVMKDFTAKVLGVHPDAIRIASGNNGLCLVYDHEDIAPIIASLEKVGNVLNLYQALNTHIFSQYDIMLGFESTITVHWIFKNKMTIRVFAPISKTVSGRDSAAIAGYAGDISIDWAAASAHLEAEMYNIDRPRLTFK